MDKPLNVLHPLADYEGCSRHYAPAWDICCPCVLPHKSESKMPEKFWLFAQKGRNLENLPSTDYVLFQHTKRVSYKDGHCLGWSRSESDAWKSPCSTSPWASVVYQELVQKSNEVLKDIENVSRRECLVPRVASFVKNARLRVLRSMLLQEGPSLLT